MLTVSVSSGKQTVEKNDSVEESNSVEQSAGTEAPRVTPRVRNGEKDGLPLVDRPLQLVRPDLTHHQHLEIVTENLQLLHHVDNAVAVVAVVGKFHTGKSFLLNQLMGKKDGFGIGPTVRPQTMGIWMWGKVSGWCFRNGCDCHVSKILDMPATSQPWEVKTPDGERLSVIFLDTEGTEEWLLHGFF